MYVVELKFVKFTEKIPWKLNECTPGNKLNKQSNLSCHHFTAKICAVPLHEHWFCNSLMIQLMMSGLLNLLSKKPIGTSVLFGTQIKSVISDCYHDAMFQKYLSSSNVYLNMSVNLKLLVKHATFYNLIIIMIL